MREAVIVSTARTGIGRAFRGSLNITKSPTLLAHAIAHVVQRAGIDGAEIDDVVIGTVLAAGTAGMNLARNASLAAGLPASVAAQTVDRQCSSGLMAIAMAAKQIIVDGQQIATVPVTGGDADALVAFTGQVAFGADISNIAIDSGHIYWSEPTPPNIRAIPR